MEHSDRIAVVPLELDWSDVGSWAAVYDLLRGMVKATSSKMVATCSADTDACQERLDLA